MTTHPEPTVKPSLRHVDVNGLSLAAFEWRPELRGQGPTLFFVHATSFHGRVWDQVIRHLPPQHVIAFEQRGHGRSEDAPFRDWQDLGQDLACAVAALDLQGAIGIGHSMGGHALVSAAAVECDRFSQLILIDPALFAPADYLLDPPPRGAPHPALKRKNRFASAQAMVDRLVGRPPYSTFDPRALHDYCVHGLRPAADGQGLELACHPSTEGHIYNTARHDPGVYASIRALRIPVTVIRVRPTDPSIQPFDTLGSSTWPELSREFFMGRDICLPEKTHLIPMEDPPFVARLIQDILNTPTAPGLRSIDG